MLGFVNEQLSVEGEENIATYYMPTWEDIFSDDWTTV